MTPPGIDPGTVRLVLQRLKHYATPGQRFEAANTKLREEFNVKLQHEIQGVSDKVDTL